MNLLTPHEVEQLVSLRLALEDALSRAKGASKYRRGAAIVALDSTVERASSVVAITRGVPVPSNGKLDDLISRLVQDFGSAWKPAVLPDIKHLRRARNASQHEGLEPDREQVPLWAGAVDAYVATLIDAQFAVDIRRVVLSDAIRDDGLRQYIYEAERARDRGEHSSCVDKAKEAYREALKRWNRLRGSRGHSFAPTNGQILDKKSFDFLRGKLGTMQAVLGAASFSPDIAEAEWFTFTIAEQSDVLNADDAERVLTFAFEWIVEYERASDAWTPNRRHRAAVERRMVRAGDSPAHIKECVAVDLQHRQVRAVFRIADVPNEDAYQMWAETLGELLPQPSGVQWWRVLDDGTVESYKAIERHPDFSDEVTILATALAQADSAVREKLDAAASKYHAAQQRRTEFAESVKIIREELPAWVGDIQWSDDGIGGSNEQLLLTVEEEVSAIRFGERPQNGMFDNRRSVRDIIIDHALVEQCYWARGQNTLAISPILDAEQLRGVFSDVDAVVRRQLEIERARKDRQKDALLAAKVGIVAKLAEL